MSERTRQQPTDGRPDAGNRGDPRKSPGRPRRVTIHDVAAAAGVAASTVSRAFSHPDRLTVETQQHVMDVAAKLGYRPSPVARALLKGQTRTLALFVGDITNPYYFGLIRGAERHAAAAGYTLVLADNESPENERQNLDRLARAVDGFIFGTSHLSDESISKLTADHHVVTVNRPIRGTQCVVIDTGQGMRQAVEHLASLGHQAMVYLPAASTVSWTDKHQWRAVKTAADRLGLTATRLSGFPGNLDAGPAAADAAIVAGATAILAHNDMLAIGVMRRLADREVKVPEQVSVIGVDDIFGSDLCHPRLTTIRAHMERAGRSAAELLLASLSNTDQPPPRPVRLPTELVVRDSTGPAPGT